MKFRGQGALEYLLIIAGALVVAAIVLMVLGGTSATGVYKQQADALCAPYTEDTCATADPDGNADFTLCEWNSTANICESKECSEYDSNLATCPTIHCKIANGHCTTK